MWSVIKNNPISAFAVLVVATTASFLGYMMVWQTNILSSPTWCAKAMGAEKVAPGTSYQQSLEALKSCNNLLMTQLSSVAIDSHINHSAAALVLVFLIVVVIAGARASFKVDKTGLEGNISRDAPAPPPVDPHVVEAAASGAAGGAVAAAIPEAPAQ
jgi:hypothetical protein